jgi:polar amino acid transport system substrate-binding protein
MASTDPWIYVQPCIFTKKGASYQTIEDVNKPEVTVGVLLGSTGETIAKQYLPNANIKSYKAKEDKIVQQCCLRGYRTQKLIHSRN